jgi:hypothetical protein
MGSWSFEEGGEVPALAYQRMVWEGETAEELIRTAQIVPPTVWAFRGRFVGGGGGAGGGGGGGRKETSASGLERGYDSTCAFQLTPHGTSRATTSHVSA